MAPLRVTPDGFDAAFSELLGPAAGPPAQPAAVTAFLDNLRASDILAGVWTESSAWARGIYVALLLLPGRTATLMLSREIERAPSGAAGDAALDAAIGDTAREGVFYVQALVPPYHPRHVALLKRHGFARLTRLEYHERSLSTPTGTLRLHESQFEWRSYSAQTHALFAETIAATYVDASDCPELTGIRPIDDVVASHKAAGPFKPQLWELALIEGRPAGCVLIGRPLESPCAEVVYTGVVPSLRRRGVGRRLLQRGLDLARTAGARSVMLAVDERNAAARQLYQRCGFDYVDEREAFWRRVAGDDRAPGVAGA